MALGTDNLVAYGHYTKGRERFGEFNREAVAEAKSEFSKAIELDKNFARAYGWLAYACHTEASEGWSSDRKASMDRAVELAMEGVQIRPDDYYTHWNLATIYVANRDFEAAEKEFAAAEKLNPIDADVLIDKADMHSYRGDADMALDCIQRAFNLKIPEWYHWALGFALFQNRKYEEAVTVLERMGDPPNTAYLLLAACKAKIGKPIATAEVKARLDEKDKQWTPDHLGEFPFVNDEDRQHYCDAMRAAGIEVP
jgi:adenylate cyclase